MREIAVAAAVVLAVAALALCASVWFLRELALGLAVLVLLAALA